MRRASPLSGMLAAFTIAGLVVLGLTALLAQNTVVTTPRITGVPVGTIRTLHWAKDDAANLADTNWVTSSVYTLPANTLVTNGDRLELEAIITLSATVSTKSWDCRIGYTAFAVATGFAGGYTLTANATGATSTTLLLRAQITRQSATTAGGTFAGFDLGGAVVKSSVYQTGQALTWANANNVACAVKDSVGTAASETIRELRVQFVPR